MRTDKGCRLVLYLNHLRCRLGIDLGRAVRNTEPFNSCQVTLLALQGVLPFFHVLPTMLIKLGRFLNKTCEVRDKEVRTLLIIV
jgi:hypothetical protein